MNNILIITSSRDDTGVGLAFYKDINDIQNLDLRTMVEKTIKGEEWNKDDLWVNSGICGSDRGWVFNQDMTNTPELPLIVNHIVNYCL